MMGTVSFPGLDLEFHLNRVAFHIGSWPMYWYGIIIVTGFLLAILHCCHVAKRFGIKQDDIIGMFFFAIPLFTVGARLYYVLFYLDPYHREGGSLDSGAIIRIWDGGLAVYSGVVMVVVVLLMFCKVRQVRFLASADLGAFSMLIGQIIGRWGNFVNVEAYGDPTELPQRMGIYAYADGVRQYMEAHPTFLYESLWNLLSFALLVQIAWRWQRFDSRMFLSYLAWYGMSRGFIEGLCTDSLYLFGTSTRVSQLFGLVTAAVAIVLLVVNLSFHNHDPAKLWVNQMKRRARRVALVYPAGVPTAEKRLKAQKRSLEREFAKIGECALSKGTPAEEVAELVISLEAQEDFNEVRQPKAGG